MDKFFDFLADNYIIFIIISGVLVFALIGFIVMGKKKGKATDDNKQETPVNNNQTVEESAQSVIPQPEEAPMSVPPVEGTVESPNLQVTEETQTTEAPTLVIESPEVQTPVVESQPIAMETQMPMQDATLMPETPVVPEVPADGMQETQDPEAPTLVIEDSSVQTTPVEPQVMEQSQPMDTQVPMQEPAMVSEVPADGIQETQAPEAPTLVIEDSSVQASPVEPQVMEQSQIMDAQVMQVPEVPIDAVQETQTVVDTPVEVPESVAPLGGVQPVGQPQTSIFETPTDINQNNVQ